MFNRIFRRNAQLMSWHPGLISHFSEVLKPKVYAEIGVYEGETFALIDAPKKYAVDISDVALSSIPQNSSTVKVLGTSRTLAQLLLKENVKLDMLFIDANHDKNEVIKDFINLEPFCTEECIVLFHDTYPKNLEYADSRFCGDAYAAIPILSDKYTNWAFVGIPIHPGLTIASRFPLFPSWLRGK